MLWDENRSSIVLDIEAARLFSLSFSCALPGMISQDRAGLPYFSSEIIVLRPQNYRFLIELLYESMLLLAQIDNLFFFLNQFF